MIDLSLFDAIKYLFYGTIVIGYLLSLKKFPSFSKKTRVILALCCLILATVIHFFPYKYLPFRYSCAEELISSQYGAEVEFVAEGEASCGIIYSKGTDTQLVFCRKDERGYCPPDDIDRITIHRETIGDCTVVLCRVPQTDDYYADLFAGSKGETISISDNRRSEFGGISQVLSVENSLWVISAVAYVGNDLDDYSITIGDATYSFPYVN